MIKKISAALYVLVIVLMATAKARLLPINIYMEVGGLTCHGPCLPALVLRIY